MFVETGSSVWTGLEVILVSKLIFSSFNLSLILFST